MPGKYRQEPQEIKAPKGVRVNANLLLNCFWKEVTSKYVTKEMCTLLQACRVVQMPYDYKMTIVAERGRREEARSGQG